MEIINSMFHLLKVNIFINENLTLSNRTEIIPEYAENVVTFNFKDNKLEFSGGSGNIIVLD
jgi:hypothetical protein